LSRFSAGFAYTKSTQFYLILSGDSRRANRKNWGCRITALCAYLKPRNIFENGASRRFQKYFCTTQSLNRL
jgi:hypothetical protein